MRRAGVIIILVLAFCGLSDSAYIAQNEAGNTPLICNVQNISGCNIVATSQYAHFFGFSIADYGIVFYSLMFILAALELVFFNRFLRRVLQGLSIIGIASSIYLTFLEVFVIRALCIYCLVSAIITIFVLIAASFIEPIRKKALYV